MVEASPPQELSDAGRDDDRHRPAQTVERREVELVEVGVGDEDPVERAERARIDRGFAAKVPDPAP